MTFFLGVGTLAELWETFAATAVLSFLLEHLEADSSFFVSASLFAHFVILTGFPFGGIVTGSQFYWELVTRVVINVWLKLKRAHTIPSRTATARYLVTSSKHIGESHTEY